MYKKLIITLIISWFIAGCANGTERPPADGGDPIQQQPDRVETGQPDESDEKAAEIDDESEPEPEPEPEAPIEIRYYMNKIYDIKPLHDDVEDKVVLLTFDDGPKEAELLSSLLDTLDKHHAKAIFFVNGFRVKANPDLLQSIYDKGHAIGNHSWDHINLKTESEETIRQQVDDVQQIVEETVGVRPVFFRPPHGSSNEFLREYVKEQGMLFMTWSNGSRDWMKEYQTPEAVIASVLEQLRPGSNILMHELSWTAEALDELLTVLTEEGYQFVDPHSIQIVAPDESVE